MFQAGPTRPARTAPAAGEEVREAPAGRVAADAGALAVDQEEDPAEAGQEEAVRAAVDRETRVGRKADAAVLREGVRTGKDGPTRWRSATGAEIRETCTTATCHSAWVTPPWTRAVTP